jgi:antagonist of KipI
MKDVFRIISPGPYTTVQDRGRFDYLHMGVPVSGPLDSYAFGVANMLVGNSRDCAVLEMTFVGARIEVMCEADIAVTGAEMDLHVNGAQAPGWASVRVGRGDIVRFGQARSGCRAYLAVTGGVDVPLVMGSRSTYVGGRLGGLGGRPLKPGDVIRRGAGDLLRRPRALSRFPAYSTEIVLRAIPGPQDDCFEAGLGLFFSSTYTVATHADRMGYRLEGPRVLRDEGAPLSIVSEPTLPGNVQVPADGLPIILLVEQTLGGYTKIATVISPDLSGVAQAKPGDSVRFVMVTIEEAHSAVRIWARYLAEIEAFLAAAP